MSRLPDPFLDGLARGWKVTQGEAGLPESINCDVAIVGSGAGAGITAELLTRAGLDVVIIEEGPLRTSRDFRQREEDAFTQLYQESATRSTADKSIAILQGRCVGGTTVVNWTSSFRTPPGTLKYWRETFGLQALTQEEMQPWFEQAERRLNITPWEPAPNPNNELLRAGATKLGIEAAVIPRNVKNCWNLGSCGLGCPTNAKQSMLVTTLPTALENGARLFCQTRAEQFEWKGDTVNALLCAPVRLNGERTSSQRMRVTARHFVVAGGAINSPALLLRSKVPDPHGRLGIRTFLHPVMFSAAVYDETVAGWQGAPQSIYTDHFLNTQPIDGPLGYKIEATPVQPAFASALLGGTGERLAQRIQALPNTQMLLALLRDGFHPEASGGAVKLNPDGSPRLDYPLTDVLFDGARRALLSMAELQFAAGAKKVLPAHQHADYYTSWPQAKEAIMALDMQPSLARIGCAHVMGGCGMAGEERLGVIRDDGSHWQLRNLSVHDGSAFPTSIGANPQLSIYGLVNRMTQGLLQRLGITPDALA